jgi:hypothetical protein
VATASATGLAESVPEEHTRSGVYPAVLTSCRHERARCPRPASPRRHGPSPSGACQGPATLAGVRECVRAPASY